MLTEKRRSSKQSVEIILKRLVLRLKMHIENTAWNFQTIAKECFMVHSFTRWPSLETPAVKLLHKTSSPFSCFCCSPFGFNFLHLNWAQCIFRWLELRYELQVNWFVQKKRAYEWWRGLNRSNFNIGMYHRQVNSAVYFWLPTHFTETGSRISAQKYCWTLC